MPLPDDFEVSRTAESAMLRARIIELENEVRGLRSLLAIARLALKFTDGELRLFRELADELTDVLRGK